jgi:hypothetical protein
MQQHPVEVVPESAPIDAVVKSLVPAARRFVVKNLMFCSANASLRSPPIQEFSFIKKLAVILDPPTDRRSPSLVDYAEAGELDDRLRELLDLR